MLEPLRYVCPHGWQVNESSVDPSQGQDQSYVEDCQVCCRPLTLEVHVVGGEAWAEATPDSD